MKLKAAPQYIDNAQVLFWAWSGDKPFGHISDGIHEIEIHGLAICKYPKDEIIYRFSCNANWETEMDADYGSIEEAMEIPNQYKNQEIVWDKNA